MAFETHFFFSMSARLPSPCLAYLRSVDYFTQRPHQGAVHSHQLLRLYLVSLVQHHPGAEPQTLSVQPHMETEQVATLCSTCATAQMIRQHLILSSWFFRAFMTSENSSEMSSLWASNSKMILSTRSANHSSTAAKS